MRAWQQSADFLSPCGFSLYFYAAAAVEPRATLKPFKTLLTSEFAGCGRGILLCFEAENDKI